MVEQFLRDQAPQHGRRAMIHLQDASLRADPAMEVGMKLRDILVLVDTDTKAAGSYALSLASLIEAHLTAAAIIAERPVGPFSEFPSELLEAMYDESRRSAEQALQDFEAVAGMPNVATDVS